MSVRSTVVAFGLGGIVTVLSALFSGSHSDMSLLFSLLVLAVTTAQIKVRLYKDSTISFLTSVVLLSLLMGGTREALLAGVCGVAVQTYFPQRKLVIHRLVFNLGMIAVTIQATAWLYAFFL